MSSASDLKSYNLQTKDTKTEGALDKKKLKRFVIKRRWQKLFNTYIFLRRMGATLTFDDPPK